jgi:hypothetical protein
MIKWIKAFILGLIFWVILTIIYGFLVSILEFIGTYILDFKLPNIFKSNYSNFNNLILLPVSMWLSFKITKTSFLGTQKDIPITKLQNELIVNELRGTIKDAYKLNKNDRERVATNVMKQMLTYVSEIEGLPKPSKKLDEICKRQIREAGIKRKNAVTSLGIKNPDWIQAALIESFLHSNSGFLEKKNSKTIMDLISSFIRENTK